MAVRSAGQMRRLTPRSVQVSPTVPSAVANVSIAQGHGGEDGYLPGMTTEEFWGIVDGGADPEALKRRLADLPDVDWGDWARPTIAVVHARTGRYDLPQLLPRLAAKYG
jgi:hypothetical protein